MQYAIMELCWHFRIWDYREVWNNSDYGLSRDWFNFIAQRGPDGIARIEQLFAQLGVTVASFSMSGVKKGAIQKIFDSFIYKKASSTSSDVSASTEAQALGKAPHITRGSDVLLQKFQAYNGIFGSPSDAGVPSEVPSEFSDTFRKLQEKQKELELKKELESKE